ncbi:unnamed protein product [Prorocentrum cordatum]|uniref:WWE domain-containing protein n=1 Tax=Prorocentrum cordatum TaxID=2364126 RepID=A0ABN9VUW4_9DINO|nr:unnamed protein product [Polarella glacialis]
MAGAACALDRRRPAGCCLAPTALEPGAWECSVDGGGWVPYEWPVSSLLEQAFCQHQEGVEFCLLGHQYRVRFLEARGDGAHAASQLNVKTGRVREVRRWPSRGHRHASEQRQRALEAAAKQAAWAAWLLPEWAWVLFDGGGGAVGAPATPKPQGPPADALPVPAGPPPARQPYSLGRGEDRARRPCLGEAWWPEPLRSWPVQGLACAAHPLGRKCNFALHRVLAPEPGRADAEWSALAARLALLRGVLARMSGDDFLDGAGREPLLGARLLWHGTRSVDGLLDICSDGFDRARAATCAFGRGCYFAASAAYSDRYACGVRVPGDPPQRRLRAVLLAAVLVGELVKGQPNMYPPPVKPHSRTGERYENACDKTESPGIIVTFRDGQAMPAYVLVYEMAS